ncbi:MAG TPA: hypothetical protein VJ583_04110 [Nitrososphaeraceae archaeon]|nr:hypothetical protein [Nitrososphaeraceae archaeon]
MKQIYFIITLLLTSLTIGILLSLNSVGITFAQEKNETLSEIEDSPLITTPELEESVKANNNTAYGSDNNTSMIEKILP